MVKPVSEVDNILDLILSKLLSSELTLLMPSACAFTVYLLSNTAQHNHSVEHEMSSLQAKHTESTVLHV